jgi:hypothetical protein
MEWHSLLKCQILEVTAAVPSVLFFLSTFATHVKCLLQSLQMHVTTHECLKQIFIRFDIVEY